MSKHTIHRAKCKKANCRECLDERPSVLSEYYHFTVSDDIWDGVFYDSTMQPGRRVVTDWDFNRLIEEWVGEE